MNKCLCCNTVSLSPNCQECRWSPSMVDGFLSYSPDLTQEHSGFKASYFTELAQLEATNFWFQVRNQLIIWGLSAYYPKFQSFLEIGCGTGYVLAGISRAFPNAYYTGSELFTQGLHFAAARNPEIQFMQMDARNLPFVAQFDCIGAFDVLEHIQEDKEVLSQIHQALKPEGLLLLTVPQHQWLWSQSDEHACHVRRYCAKDLHCKVSQAGFEIIRSTSFVFSLLPAMCSSRWLQKLTKKNEDPYKELRLPVFLNYIFKQMLTAEAFLIRKGINFPIGGSRMVIARKT